MAQKTVCDRCGRVVGEIEEISSLGVTFRSSFAVDTPGIEVEALDICERCKGPVAKLIDRLLLNKPAPEKPPERPPKKRAKKAAPKAETLAPEAPAANGEAHEAWNGEQG